MLATAAAMLALLIALIAPTATDTIRRVSPFRYSFLRIEQARSLIQVFALGDSHTGMGFRSPDPRLQNISFGGESIRQMQVRYDYLKGHMPNARAVTLQYQPHMFFPLRDISEHRVRHLAYRQLLAGGEEFHPLEGLLLQFDPSSRVKMPQMLARRILGLDLPRANPWIGETGFFHQDKTPSRAFADHARQLIDRYHGTEALPALRTAYENLIADLQAGGLRVILVRYPLAPQYRAALPNESRAEAERYYSDLIERFGVDHCGSWDAITDDRLFFDTDHLSPEGAEIYWETVLADALVPLLD